MNIEKEELEKFYEDFESRFEIPIIVSLKYTLKKIKKKFEKIEGRREVVKTFFDRETQIYIIDLPTKEEPEDRGRRYHRIAIKFNSTLYSETLKSEEELLKEVAFNYKYPDGRIDSYTLVLVAMYRLDDRAFFKGKKDKNLMICYIISKNPKKVLERLYKILIKFYRKRLAGLLASLKLENYFYEYDRISKFPRFLLKAFYNVSSYLYRFARRMLYLIDKLERTIIFMKAKKVIKNPKQIKQSIADKLYTLLYKKDIKKEYSLEEEVRNYREIPILLYIRSMVRRYNTVRKPNDREGCT
jgi:hypothetical protein